MKYGDDHDDKAGSNYFEEKKVVTATVRMLSCSIVFLFMTVITQHYNVTVFVLIMMVTDCDRYCPKDCGDQCDENGDE